MAQKVSIARHQGLLSLLLKEVQETLKGRQNTAGPVWEEHRRISGYRPSSGASRSRPSSGNSRGRGRRQPAAFSPYFHRKNSWTRAFVCLAFSEQNALPSTSERITLTLNGLTSVIDCVLHPNRQQNAPSAAVFAVNGNLQNQAYLRSGTVVFLRFKNDRPSYTVKF